MLEKFFGNNPQTPQEQEENERQGMLELKAKEELDELRNKVDNLNLCVLGKLEKYLDEKEIEKQSSPVPYKLEVVTISKNGYEIDSEGFRYVGFWCSDAEKNKSFTYEVLGMTSPQVVTQAGYNFDNWKDGTVLKAVSDPILVVFIRQNIKPL